jgi:hypothetical protein
MGDVDGEGLLDLIVGAGKDHAPEVVAYAGASIGGKGRFGTSWRASSRSMPSARGGVSVALLRRSMGPRPTTSSWDRLPASRVK